MSNECYRPDSDIGRIVCTVYDFLENGKDDKSYLVDSPLAIWSDPMYASEFFYQTRNNNYVVKPDHLPLDPNIRSVLTLGDNVLIEFGRVDFGRLSEALDSYESPSIVRGASVFYEGEKILNSRTQNANPKGGLNEIDMRTLVSILPTYQTHEWGEAMRVIDNLYNQNCFKQSGDFGVFTRQELRQEMTQKMIRDLRQQQKPVLGLRPVTKWTIAKRIHYAKILEMNNRQLGDFARRLIQ